LIPMATSLPTLMLSRTRRGIEVIATVHSKDTAH
jgi:hypothetical protein